MENKLIPEKWFVKPTTLAEAEILNKWRVNKIKDEGGTMYIYLTLNHNCFLLSKHQHDGSYFYDSNEIRSFDKESKLPPFYDDYVELTFNQWEKLILNKSVKLAFKGFNSKLQCRDTKFEIGVTYSLPILNRKPKLCTSDGYHYCNRLEEVFNHYVNSVNNRFCIIEVLGDFSEDETKGTTYSFRIIRELTREEVDNYLNADKLLDVEYENYEHKKNQRDKAEIEIRRNFDNKELIDKAVKEELAKIKQKTEDKAKERTAKIAKNMKLDIVKAFQEKYPHTQIGGSVGLFLHGIELNRFYNNCVNDLDIITPYYTLFENINDKITINLLGEKEYKSGCDFDECITISGIKADVRIDNHQKYNIIEFEGFKYKVSALEAIWAAKLRYNAKKHNDDLRESMHLK